jgi:hypothetical protein
MKKVIYYNEFSPETGIRLVWERGYEIRCSIDNGVVTLTANKEGLLSLANHLVNLAQEVVPSGGHIHLDDYNCLEDGSAELIISKKIT